MAPRLPKDALSEVAEVISLLSPEIAVASGDSLMIAEIICERELSRQTIWSCEAITEALARHKQRHGTWLTNAGIPAAKTPLQQARETIQELRAQLARRDATLNEYLEMMARYLKNARDHGILPEQLETPLPKVQRGAKRLRRSNLP